MNDEQRKKLNGKNSFSNDGMVEEVFIKKEWIDAAHAADNEVRISENEKEPNKKGRPHLFFFRDDSWLLIMPITKISSWSNKNRELLFFVRQRKNGNEYIYASKSINVPFEAVANFRTRPEKMGVKRMIKMKKELISAAEKRLNKDIIENPHQVDNKKTDLAMEKMLSEKKLKIPM